MAVIVTNMDMPRGCFECPLREEHGFEGDWCAVSEGCDLIGETTRPNYCPLKSTDEMIEEIKNIVTIGNTWELAVKEEVIDILNKYCDKENKNGK